MVFLLLLSVALLLTTQTSQLVHWLTEDSIQTVFLQYTDDCLLAH